MSTFDLPQGWAETTLGALGRWSSGGTPSRGNSAFYGGKIPWVKTGELQDGVIKATEENITEEALGASAAKVFPERTLLVAMYGATIGKVGILGTRAATNQACAALVAEGLTTDLIPFVFYYLRSRRDELRAAGQGGAQPNISQALLKEFPCRLPPLAEQRRIVAKLEALLARSRRAKGALDAIPALLEQFRQSVLAAAFRGDLTGDWREANSDEEPASKLLERIRSERLRRWEEAELERMRTSGKVPRDDRWKGRYDEPVQLDAPALPELPNGWSWAPLDLLLTGLRNGIAAKPDRESGLPILRISAVRPMSVDLADVRYLPESDEHLPYLLKEGDLLFTRYNGNADLVGSCAVVSDLQCPTVYPDKLIRGRVVEGHVLPELVAMAASCGASRAFIDERSKSAAGQVGISGSDLRKVPIPVPPLAEQRVLIDRVNRAFAKAASIDEVARSAAAGIPQMDASIMTKAFRGELVPRDPTDEPASVLLQRIRAARDKPVDGELGPRTKRRNETKVA